MKQPVFIRVYIDEKLDGVKQFSSDQIVIGTSENSTLILEDESASPVHAVIEERDAGFYISDLGSTNGTKVNGDSIIDCKIESGSTIEVGNYFLEFFVGIPKPSSPPKLPGVGKKESVDEITAVDAKVTESDGAEKENGPVAVPVSADNSAKASSKKEDPKTVPPKIEDPKNKASKKNVVGAANVINLGSKSGHRNKIPGRKEKNSQTKVYSSRFGKRKAGGTFAPKSEVNSLDDVIRPGKGTVVEVLVAWNQKVIATHHFSEPRSYTIGPSSSADVTIPIRTGQGTKVSFLSLDSGAQLSFGKNPTGQWTGENGQLHFSELRKQNRLIETKKGSTLQLQQGEMVRWDLEGGLLSIFIRFMPDSVKPVVAPFLDFTTTEFTGIILAGVISAILGLYMMVYSPVNMDDEALLEVPIRTAVVRFNRPIRKKVKVTKIEKTRKVVKVDMKKSQTKKAPTTTAKKKPGKAAKLRKSKSKKKTKQVVSAVKKGGAKKTGKKRGSGAKSKKRDVSKMGILNVFGSKGINDKLNKSYSGAGGLAGVANRATGASGFDRNRRGKNAGSRFKNSKAGGNGVATEGISGAGTSGRGTGGPGSGTGDLGKKGRVDINLGGQEAEVSGSIDREAIRRVIIKNKRQIKACYDRALNRNRDLYGKLVIEWNIEEKGIVTKARIKSNSLGSNSVGNCIVRKLRTWRFPEPPQDQVAQVAYPFVFQTQ